MSKKRQKIYLLDLENTIRLLDEVVTKHHRRGNSHNWCLEPLAVVSLLSRSSKRINGSYFIEYNEARKIFDKATSPKLGASMNRGLGEIKERIKKMKFELKEENLFNDPKDPSIPPNQPNN